MEIERVARFADIDTRRAMGFPPRKLPPSDLVLPKAIPHFNLVTFPYSQIVLNERATIIASEQGTVEWSFGTPTKFIIYCYYRNGKPIDILDVEGDTIYDLRWKYVQ